MSTTLTGPVEPEQEGHGRRVHGHDANRSQVLVFRFLVGIVVEEPAGYPVPPRAHTTHGGAAAAAFVRHRALLAAAGDLTNPPLGRESDRAIVLGSRQMSCLF